jgi:hypothetical protein
MERRGFLKRLGLSSLLGVGAITVAKELIVGNSLSQLVKSEEKLLDIPVPPQDFTMYAKSGYFKLENVSIPTTQTFTSSSGAKYEYDIYQDGSLKEIRQLTKKDLAEMASLMYRCTDDQLLAAMADEPMGELAWTT